MIPFGETMDKPSGGHMDRSVVQAPTSAPVSGSVPAAPGSLSLDDRYEAENQSLRVKQWQEGHFAASMTPPTWTEDYHKWTTNTRDECMKMDDGGAPCGCCSAIVCGALGASRIGNMAILKQSTEWVEEEEEDENGEPVTRRSTRPRLEFIVGPVSLHILQVFLVVELVYDLTVLFPAQTLLVLADALPCDLPLDFWRLDCHFVDCHSRKAPTHHHILGNMHNIAHLFTCNDRISRPWNSATPS